MNIIEMLSQVKGDAHHGEGQKTSDKFSIKI